METKKTVEKFNKTKSWSFGNTNKIDKLLARFTMEKNY